MHTWIHTKTPELRLNCVQWKTGGMTEGAIKDQNQRPPGCHTDNSRQYGLWASRARRRASSQSFSASVRSPRSACHNSRSVEHVGAVCLPRSKFRHLPQKVASRFSAVQALFYSMPQPNEGHSDFRVQNSGRWGPVTHDWKKKIRNGAGVMVITGKSHCQPRSGGWSPTFP